jgi:hypothetical protein
MKKKTQKEKLKFELCLFGACLSCLFTTLAFSFKSRSTNMIAVNYLAPHIISTRKLPIQ